MKKMEMKITQGTHIEVGDTLENDFKDDIENSQKFEKNIEYTMDTILTPEEFYSAMVKLDTDYNGDTEMVHVVMDDLMCEVLKSLGFKKGIAYYESVDKWHA